MRQSRPSKTQRPSVFSVFSIDRSPKDCERCKELLENGDPDEYFFCDECGKMLRPPKIGSEKLDFDDIPKPALFEIMLNLDRKELHYLCTSNRLANKICKESRFRDEYNERHAAGLFNSEEPIRCNKAKWPNTSLDGWMMTQLGLENNENTVRFTFFRTDGHITIQYRDEWHSYEARAFDAGDDTIYLELRRQKPFDKNHLYLMKQTWEDGEKYLNDFGKKRWFPTTQEGLKLMKAEPEKDIWVKYDRNYDSGPKRGQVIMTLGDYEDYWTKQKIELPEAAADEFLDIIKKASLSCDEQIVPDVFFQDKRSKQQGGKLSRRRRRSKRRSRSRRSKR